jgi:hypothetical protein
VWEARGRRGSGRRSCLVSLACGIGGGGGLQLPPSPTKFDTRIGGKMSVGSTANHVREVFSSIDADFALVHAVRSLNPEDPTAKQVRSWIQERAKELSAADIKELLAFGYLGWARHSVPASAKPSYSVLLKALQKLEPDFFPVLLAEIKSNESASPTFRAAMATARERITELESRVNSGTATQPTGEIAYDTSGPGADPSESVGALLFGIGLVLIWWGGREESKEYPVIERAKPEKGDRSDAH